jgi:hypothetical protein
VEDHNLWVEAELLHFQWCQQVVRMMYQLSRGMVTIQLVFFIVGVLV